MALDNAQFMSELSIVDPPGTDPLSEGDDQIRTSKRTQQQSFPNVDAAVTKTAAELNDVATQSGNNVFSGATNQFNGTTLRPTALTDADDAGFNFIGDLGTLRWAILRDNTIVGGDLTFNRFDANGAFQGVAFRLNAVTGRATFAEIAFFNSVTRFADGNATTPSMSFTSDAGLGISRGGAGLLSFSADSVEQMRIFSRGIISIPDGTAALPRYSFAAGTAMGMFRITNNQLGLAVATLLQLSIKDGTIGMPRLGTGPGGALVSGDLYVKQSQSFLATELIVGMQP